MRQAIDIPQAPARAVPKAVSDRTICGLFVLPALGVLLLMVAYPFVSLLYYSTLRFSILNPDKGSPFIGIDNYVRILSNGSIWERFVFTGQFVLATVVVQFIIGVAVAYAFQRNFKGRDLLFTVAMLPMMVCPIVVGFLWRYMFNSEWGVMNYLITLVGLEKIDWLGVPTNALWAVVIADAWMWTPFVILLATAAFRGIPTDINEAAEIDGASPFFRFTRVTLPMSMPILLIAFLLRLIDAFKQSDLFFAMTGGGPGSDTETVAFRLGKIAFSHFYTGQASAFAVIMLIIITGLSLIFVRLLTRQGRQD
ncbi:MAG TPA: sugar ABC transporter permease [Geminicoccus sp.]|jgi:multiple sugar transport system permease protein|uniref:carbohydrate ABC transporter permease n=1 Tax=Geminicoccus sp. TaxID=2024832 RepID=UPI002E32BF79|nr:sugar ABC transporter permease [Geminicoccus sp.]HEX2529709.1 sugar ABC transporter permease [Geminicoccus sp.]